MKATSKILGATVVLSLMSCQTQQTTPTAVSDELSKPVVSEACWGQATKIFAQMGEMGFHASGQEEPREGLRNLARLLYDQGVIADDTMEALGRFVADQLGLSIEACME